MAYRTPILILIFVVLLIVGVGLAVYFYIPRQSSGASLLTAEVTRRNLEATVSTNGTIAPIVPPEIYAPIDGFVSDLTVHPGEHVQQGQVLMQLKSDSLKSALSEAQASLAQAELDSYPIIHGPTKAELAAAQAAIDETELELKQTRENLQREERLLQHNASTRTAVSDLKEKVARLELQLQNQKQKKENLTDQYTPEEKARARKRISDLNNRVTLLERQLAESVIHSPRDGVLYSLDVVGGAYVTTGTVLARVFKPGEVRLIAYVDEPELGRVHAGQDVTVHWDGLPDRTWHAKVERVPDTVTSLGTRSVGRVPCSFASPPPDLIPNINVNVQIVTAEAKNALVVPRAAVFVQNGHSTVITLHEGNQVFTPVDVGITTPQEAQITQGVHEGETVVINPEEESASSSGQ